MACFASLTRRPVWPAGSHGEGGGGVGVGGAEIGADPRHRERAFGRAACVRVEDVLAARVCRRGGDGRVRLSSATSATASRRFGCSMPIRQWKSGSAPLRTTMSPPALMAKFGCAGALEDRGSSLHRVTFFFERIVVVVFLTTSVTST